MKKLTLLSIFAFLAVAYAFAQTPLANPKNLNWVPGEPQGIRADPDVYLQGTFVELGIDAAGSCGTWASPTPGGYHSWFYGLGFVADFNLDGWGVGTPPYSGDYFLPGYPWEGWLAEFTFQGNDYTFINCGATSQVGVPQTSLTNTSAGSNNSALWIGTALGGGQSLEVRQNFHFNDIDGKFYIDVTLTNVGTEPLENVEYARAVDPDMEVNWTGNYGTSNYVSHQPTGGNNLAEVRSFGLDYNMPMALQLTHPNAKAHVNVSTLDITTPNTPLDFTNAPTAGAPYVADVGVAVAVRFPVLNPGHSETFTVVYLLNEREVSDVPVSNWALFLMVGLIVIFTIVRFRRMN
jgi:hypothetical protein